MADVPASVFFTEPKVDSAVVRIETAREPLLAGAARERFFVLAHGGFSEKRKQIHNSLARYLRCDPATVGQWLAAAEIERTRRAQTLSMGEWLRLTHASLIETAMLPRADVTTPLKVSRRTRKQSAAENEEESETT